MSSLPVLTTTTAAKETTASPVSFALNNLDVLKCIISFVGSDHYLFVASVNRRFKEAYSSLFPNHKTTIVTASTTQVATFCWTESLRQKNSRNDVSYDELHSCQQALVCSAASHGNIPAIEYLVSVKCMWNAYALNAAAAKNGHLHVLQWCRDTKGTFLDEHTCAAAASGGHLSVLKWCRKNGCPWNANTCSSAAGNGHLKVLKWCRGNQCPWDKLTVTAAASNGHVDVLKWCQNQGCPWDEMAFSRASWNGHVNVMDWCLENGYPWDGMCVCTKRKDAQQQARLIEWCREHGCTRGENDPLPSLDLFGVPLMDQHGSEELMAFMSPGEFVEVLSTLEDMLDCPLGSMLLSVTRARYQSFVAVVVLRHVCLHFLLVFNPQQNQ